MRTVPTTYGLADLPELPRGQLDRADKTAAAHPLYLTVDEAAVFTALAHGMRYTTIAASGSFSYTQVRYLVHRVVKANEAHTAGQLLFWLGVQEGERRAR